MSAENERIQISDELVNRLKNYMNDPMYKEAVENSSTYNERLVKERKLRLPFIDAQTGVAQSDCYIWSSKLDRMPGYHSAQLYSYPARRWRKKRRQYLLNDNYSTTNTIKEHSESNSNDSALISAIGGQIGPNGGGVGSGVSNPDVSTINMNATNYNNNANIVQNGNCLSMNNNTNSNSALNDIFDDSKDSWLRYDDDGSDLPDAGELDDPESDYDDYEEYNSRKKKSKRKETTTTSSTSSSTTTPTLKKKRSEYTDSEKPYQCELCGARYKTRPGLSYHYSHSHQENNTSNNNSNGALSSGNGSLIPDEDSNFFGSTTIQNAKSNMQQQNQQIIAGNHHHHHHHPHLHHSIQSPNTNHSPSSTPSSHHHSHHHHSHLHHSLSQNSQSPIPIIGTNHLPINSSSSISATRGQINQSSDDNLKDRKENNKQQKSTTTTTATTTTTTMTTTTNTTTKRASPSNYCDFCLGDSNENKKTQEAEDLVSCSDCGRSAHPSCLQFTPTMILSVKKYRWQCIECKSCGICGTSDNDDQLLFCDDCDRGYHMYCLKPPLTEPPEGSWSCQICIEEYHTPKSTSTTTITSTTTATTTTMPAIATNKDEIK
ncbi:Zinc finger protein ubi-d4 [Dermatophagoides farinae]|uniref:Zinc finger protein ubi-d4 n=1 Tax=Dermatophagoides farinae TaxID=6954 RepID=A0A922L8G3_DERFA|nr:Zinc finger protein ubi-d4 [Dermatophagoides farinae]